MGSLQLPRAHGRFQAALPILVMMPIVFLAPRAARAITVKLEAAEGPDVRVALHLEDRVELELPEQPSTGFSWHTQKSDHPVLEQVGSSHRVLDGRIGSVGLRSFTWRAAEAGSADLVLTYNRSFEPGVAAAKTYTIHASVQPDPIQPGKASSADAPMADHPILIGSYQGQLPCADCSQIRQQLLLYAKSPAQLTDTAYVLKQTYVSAPGGSPTFIETGAWKVLRGTPADANAVVYRLIPGGSGGISDFAARQDSAMGPDRLVQLDAQGIPIQGPGGKELSLQKSP
jgi:inhibitor of cysteine peptidase